jgi:hypothetical protein
MRTPASSGSSNEPVPFAPNFVERVLREAKRRQSNSRRTRTFAAGAMLVAALVAVGRVPRHLRHVRPAPDTAALLAVSDWDAADIELAGGLTGELVAEEDADADPASYFVPETPGQADGQTEGQADDGDDSDLAVF